MAQTLAESFLADLDELSDEEPIAEEEEQKEEKAEGDDVSGTRLSFGQHVYSACAADVAFCTATLMFAVHGAA